MLSGSPTGIATPNAIRDSEERERIKRCQEKEDG
jgi:hypothetical protein